MRRTYVLALALLLAGPLGAARAAPDADATAPTSGAAAIAPAPASTPPPADPRLTKRKCTGWAAHAPKTTRDFVFQRERLVQRATEEMEVSYQLWDVDDALDDRGADAACREKARAFCVKETAAPGLCRFQVHPGLTNGGWEAATSVDAKPPPKKKRPKKPAGQGKDIRRTP